MSEVYERIMAMLPLAEAIPQEQWEVDANHAMERDKAVWRSGSQQSNGGRAGEDRRACWIPSPEIAQFIAAARNFLTPETLRELAAAQIAREREAELLKQLAAVQGERDELAKHFYDARLIASNHAEHVSRLKQKLAALEDERDWLKTCTNTRAYGKLQAENDQLRTTVTSLREACEGASQALQSPVRQWDERNNRERQRDFGRTDEPYMIQVARSVIAQLATALQSSEA